MACAAPTAPSAPSAPAGPDLRTIRIDGVEWRVLAAPAEGMRGRRDFGGADGMLFDLGREVDPGTVVFVMDGVDFPLDIVWFDGRGSLIGGTTMPRCPTEPCPHHAPDRPYRWAIEGPAGSLTDLPLGALLEVPR